MTLIEDINRKITDSFIANNPIEIIITRYEKTATSSGGFAKGSSTVLDPQIVTKINPRLRGQMVELTAEDGHLIVPDFALVASLDADIIRDDEFEFDSHPYVVVLVDESRSDWAKRAYVTRLNG